MKNTKDEIKDNELENVSGGVFSMANPVVIPETQAENIARELGDGKDMGSWKTMSGEQFLKWWEETNRPKN